MRQSATRRRGAEAAIGVLAQGGTQQEAADAAHVHRATISRWLQAPDFRRRVDELAAEGLQTARRIIIAATPRAAARLRDMALEPSSLTPESRRRCVVDLLTFAEKAHEGGLVNERLTAIEERLNLKGAR
jgi:hypothetical protein